MKETMKANILRKLSVLNECIGRTANREAAISQGYLIFIWEKSVTEF